MRAVPFMKICQVVSWLYKDLKSWESRLVGILQKPYLLVKIGPVRTQQPFCDELTFRSEGVLTVGDDHHISKKRKKLANLLRRIFCISNTVSKPNSVQL